MKYIDYMIYLTAEIYFFNNYLANLDVKLLKSILFNLMKKCLKYMGYGIYLIAEIFFISNYLANLDD